MTPFDTLQVRKRHRRNEWLEALSYMLLGAAVLSFFKWGLCI